MTSAEFLTLFKPALEARLAADPDLSGVRVHLYQVNVSPPAVILIRSRVRHELDYTRAAMGPLTNEDVTIPGLIGTSSGDVQTAADQAAAIVAVMRAELAQNPPQVGGRTLEPIIDNVGWMPFPADNGGVTVDTEYDLTYTSST